jgi:hypothetical protein
MALSLRPTGLAPPAHAERPDYLVIEDGETMGRIYDEASTFRLISQTVVAEWGTKN